MVPKGTKCLSAPAWWVKCMWRFGVRRRFPGNSTVDGSRRERSQPSYAIRHERAIPPVPWTQRQMSHREREMRAMIDVPSILLVEDNPDDVELTRLAFEESKIANQLIVASDGVRALEYLLPEGEGLRLRPTVVLLDLKLPRIDGLEVLRRLRADPRTRRQPVIVLTSSGEERDIVESYQLGANSYVRKPVVFSQFVEAVRVLGLYWLTVNTPATSGPYRPPALTTAPRFPASAIGPGAGRGSV